MSVYFLDSSAIAKRYVTEIGSTWITDLIKQLIASRVHVSRICGVEVLAAITRRVRSGSLTPQAGRIAAIQFRSDFQKMQGIVEVSPALISRAMDLTEKHGLRGYDAVQLASALAVNEAMLAFASFAILISADAELNAAGTAEGLQVENPNSYP
jgi:predicted nucleic acid-binding protein